MHQHKLLQVEILLLKLLQLLKILCNLDGLRQGDLCHGRGSGG